MAAESDTPARIAVGDEIADDVHRCVCHRTGAQRHYLHPADATAVHNGDDRSSVRRERTVAVESPTRTRRLVDADSNSAVERYELSTYADGPTDERRDNGTVERQRGEVRFSRDKYAYRTAFYLNRYAVVNQSATAVITRDGGRVYRIRGSGGEIPAAERLEEFRVELLVESNSLVRQFSVGPYRGPYRRIRRTRTAKRQRRRPAWLNESAPAN